MATRHNTPEPPHDDAPHPADDGQEKAGLPVPLSNAGAFALSERNETATTVLAAQARAEIEARTYMALAHPRSVQTFRLNLLEACKRPRFAARARYLKPVGGGKKVSGFSIRFAEEVARDYRNLDVGAMVVHEDDEVRRVRVYCTDLESNVRWFTDVVVSKTVERRSPRDGEDVLSSRINSTGQRVFRIRADEDALLVKQNAAISKAARNLILDHAPADVLEEAEDQIKDTLESEDKRDPTAARKRMVDAFFRAGVMPEQLEAFLGHKIEITTPAEMGVLREVLTGMNDGEGTWADLSGQARAATNDEAPSPKSASAKLRKTAAEKPAAAQPDPAGGECPECHELGGMHAAECSKFAD